MAVANFLSKNHEVNLMFFDHGTETSYDAMNFLKDTYKSIGAKDLAIGSINRDKLASESWEEYWRNMRYEWFHSVTVPVITCHHLDDCVETWIWSSLHGTSKVIPYSNQNVIRPFRLNRKTEFVNWCRNKNIPWIEDSSNSDNKYMRNFIRNEMMSKVLVVNPGIHKVVMKKVIEEYENTKFTQQT